MTKAELIDLVCRENEGLSKKAGAITFVVQESIKNLFKKDIKNLSIETIENSKNKKYDFKIALGSLIGTKVPNLPFSNISAGPLLQFV